MASERSTDVQAFIGELDGGVFETKIGAVLSEVASGVMNTKTKGKVSLNYNLPELIEGMEVSIDVSTCDADLGNRYFGTITEALELDTAKNGYILLVQDAEPNFDVNGNSPGTPDSWISCSDQMPEKGQNVLISVNFDSSLVEPLICSARYTGSTFRRGDATIKPGNGIEQATHWMPLPEPPQEVK